MSECVDFSDTKGELKQIDEENRFDEDDDYFYDDADVGEAGGPPLPLGRRSRRHSRRQLRHTAGGFLDPDGDLVEYTGSDGTTQAMSRTQMANTRCVLFESVVLLRET